MSATKESVDAVYRWTSMGGGWRSMVACFGFGNLFHQANLLPASPNQTSLLSAISTTSGSSWYSTQLFYSPEFYNATVLSSAEELREFVNLWMGTFSDLSADTPPVPICEVAPDMNDNERAICNIAIIYGGDWAAFIEVMLQRASAAYGDAEFVKKAANEEGRTGQLQDTDLIIQTALTPTARAAKPPMGNDTDAYDIVYLGPTSDDNAMSELYTTPIPAAYVVSSDDTTAKGWWFGGAVLTTDVGSYRGSHPDVFQFDDWKHDYYLFPGKDGNTLTPNLVLDKISSSQSFQEPFVGGTNTAQAAATGSALLGSYAGSTPSVFSQTHSIERWNIETSPNLTRREKTQRLLAFDGPITNQLYSAQLLFGLAICSQWPNQCGASDSYFLDGIAADSTALSTTIGAFQVSAGADLNKTIKVVMTNTNRYWNSKYNFQQILMHYSTSFNEDVLPGEFLWIKEYNLQPLQSPQIFSEHMDADELNGLIEPIEGSSITTAILKGTTIDNPSFSVVTGQKVEILLINTNAQNIPTIIASPSAIQEATVAMGDLVVDIATNSELLSRVNEFLDLADVTSPSVGSPSGSPTTTMSGVKPNDTSGGAARRLHLIGFPIGIMALLVLY